MHPVHKSFAAITASSLFEYDASNLDHQSLGNFADSLQFFIKLDGNCL